MGRASWSKIDQVSLGLHTLFVSFILRGTFATTNMVVREQEQEIKPPALSFLVFNSIHN